MEKVMGVGLKNALAIALFTMVVIVVAKVVLTKHPVPGVSDVVQSV